MNNYRTFGITSLLLSVYFYIWSVMDSFAMMKYPPLPQQIISIILFGFGIAFMINGGKNE